MAEKKVSRRTNKPLEKILLTFTVHTGIQLFRQSGCLRRGCDGI